MALPTGGQDRYEENDPNCRNLRTVYPRFGSHPMAALAKEALQQANAAFPGIKQLALSQSGWQPRLRCTARGNTPTEPRISKPSADCLVADAISTHAKAYWQHTGLGASSRLAAVALGHDSESDPEAAHRHASAWFSVWPRSTAASPRRSGHPSGMAALHRALELVCDAKPTLFVLQIGFTSTC